jgi:hypothetical protein
MKPQFPQIHMTVARVLRGQFTHQILRRVARHLPPELPAFSDLSAAPTSGRGNGSERPSDFCSSLLKQCTRQRCCCQGI